MDQTFRRGDGIIVIDGRYAGHAGLMESVVHQKSVDNPYESSTACHVILDTGQLVTLGVECLKPRLGASGY